MTESEKKPPAQLVFGPVNSRRLGRSLGIDIIPFKTCSYDCIYCQVGRTTVKTLERKNYMDLTDLVRQLRDFLDDHDPPDYVTLSGSGEPTLHENLGEVIDGIKSVTDVPVALITNSSLFWNEQVRADCAKADLVLPSLDAYDDATFCRINRPHRDLDFSRMIRGLIEFRKGYDGAIWLEILLVGGITDSEHELPKLRKWVENIRPDRVQLNTVTRPPVEEHARGVDADRLLRFASNFTPTAELIIHHGEPAGSRRTTLGTGIIVNLLARRPCSVNDITRGLRANRIQVIKTLDELESSGVVRTVRRGKTVYYSLTGRT